MKREIEAKILDVNPEEVEEKLQALGAVFERDAKLDQVIWFLPGNKERVFRRSIRVRNMEGGTPRLTMKEKVPDGSGYNEWEVDISDYKDTVAMVDAMLANPDLRIEFSHRRHDWHLEGGLISINWIPKFNPYFEIEAESEEKLRELTSRLGYDPANLVDKGIITLLIEKIGIQWGSKIKIEP